MTDVITSRRNPLVKEVVELHRPRRRRERGQTIVEGLRLCEEALSSGVEVTDLFYVAGQLKSERSQAVLALAKSKGARVREVAPEVMGAMADTVTPQGILAVIKVPAGADDPPGDLAVVLAGVQDPGNLGTIIRTADAAAASAVILIDSTSPFSPKALRASMGSAFHLPLREMTREDFLRLVEDEGIKVWAADVSAEKSLYEIQFDRPCAVLLGNEGSGLDEGFLERFPAVRVPVHGRAESLNVAAATAVLLYEIRRQWSARI